MPLTPKGKKILAAMVSHYKKKGDGKEKGKQVFYAMINEGKLAGVEKKTKAKAKGKKK